MNLDNVKELREHLENNSPKILISFDETVRGNFYLNDDENINDKVLAEYTTVEDGLYTGYISRKGEVEADIDILKGYLDEFLESIDYDVNIAEISDFEYWCEDYGQELEQDFGGDTDEFQFNGEKEFAVELDEMHEQKEYRISIYLP
tara:strand:- start:1476 stop:1916 length:441 start_codon:yes stop_codon:yes gene_type:complete